MKTKFLSCLLTLMGVALGAWAQDETIDLNGQNYQNAQKVEKPVEGTNCTVTFDLGQNTHGTRPTYYDNGTAVRVYANNTMTVTAKNGKQISEISLVFGSGGNSNAITTSTGTYADGTWTGEAAEVIFTVGGTKGHRRVMQLLVTYKSELAPPVISGNTSFETTATVTITAEEGATIRYTIDGSDPNTSSDFILYSTPREITKTTTIKAIAIKDGKTSNVATKIFVKNVGLWTGSGTKADPFIINTPEKLDQLARYVNDGDKFEDTYFKVTADIRYTYSSAWNDVSSEENNYTRIGDNAQAFKGSFDGGGHTISGIRVYATSSYNYGLFGFLESGAVVKNVTLADSRLTVGDCGGGIVGTINMGATVENCHVLSDVCIHDKGNANNYHGGVVGRMSGGTVTGCTCSATLSIDEDKQGGCLGGIVGRLDDSRRLANCLAVNVKLPAASHFTGNGHYCGAVVGYTVTNITSNYFSGCTYGDVPATVGMGYHSLSDNGNEALPAIAIPIGTETPSLRFDADEPNPEVLEAYTNAVTYNGTAYLAESKPVSVTLNSRTLTKDGYWNTLCLPFTVSTGSSPLAGDDVVAKVFDTESNLDDAGTLTLKFTNATTIPAGTPFIIKWDNTDNDLADPTFTSVTVSSTEPAVVTSTDRKVKFAGQYTPFTIDADNINSILYVASGNKIGYSASERSLKPFRAHFWVQPNSTGQSARTISLDLGDGESSSIMTIADVPADSGAWYTLDGRRLSSQPTQRGMYISNGHKVIIR